MSGVQDIATGLPRAEANVADPALEFVGVTRNFGHGPGLVQALGPATFNVGRGEFLALLGPSGCGKSTTLNMIAGLSPPSSGTVRFLGAAVTQVNRRVGYLTQKDSLLPWRTVADNVMLPLELQGIKPRERADRAADMLNRVGLTGSGARYISELSGGMRKRVALARMLINAPETLLLDEPFGALDAQLKLVMHQQLLDLWQAERKTVLFVTHDLAEALSLADRIIVLSARPGRVKGVFRVPLPRPRDVIELQFDPAFSHMMKHLWGMIGEDLVKGEAM
jgi:NitT/TauT family transport system ATP-binding protein